MKLLCVFGLLLVCLGLFVGSLAATADPSGPTTTSQPTSPEITPTGPLPEGQNGLARKFPGDNKIASDPNVLFADDFESYSKSSELSKHWDNLYQKQFVNITTTQPGVFRGKQALELSLPKQEAELSDAVEKAVKPQRDILFLRYYSKYESPYDVTGSSHNGASISSHYADAKGMATPGIPADGKNKFLVNLETWRGEASTPSPGILNVYVYHPLQRDKWGDHFFPTGLVSPNTSLKFDYGPTFKQRPDITPKLDTWYCYEFMVKANTPATADSPAKPDGRIAIWLDGKLVADFPHLRLRDLESLKIDRFALCFHIKSNPKGPSRKWYDNIVAATTYIGPLTDPTPTH